MKFTTIIVPNIDRLRIRPVRFKLITFSNNLLTIGKLYDNDELICHTIERKWLDNKPSVSCVPAGVYDLKPTNSPKFGMTYYISNPSLGVSLLGRTTRTHILFHAANKPSQLQGCIAPVSSFGIMGDEWAGFNSRVAYNKFMELLDGDEHQIEIKRY